MDFCLGLRSEVVKVEELTFLVGLRLRGLGFLGVHFMNTYPIDLI